MQSRLELRQQIDRRRRHLENQLTQSHDRLRQSAYDLLIDPGFREALDLSARARRSATATGGRRWGSRCCSPGG